MCTLTMVDNLIIEGRELLRVKENFSGNCFRDVDVFVCGSVFFRL